MTAKDLKNALLQEAVQGKLVPQIASEGNAKDLLEEIRKEKAKLVKEGKLKKEKPLPEITEEDIPFDIPENWCWCRLNDLCVLIEDCPHSTAKDEGIGFPLIRTPNIGEGRLHFEGVHRVSKKVFDERNFRAIPKERDLIFAREAPAGNVAVIQKDEIVCLGQRTVLIRPLHEILNADFLAYYILSPSTQRNLVRKAAGTTVTHVNMADIRSFPIPLPPLAEQKRIVAAIEKFMPLIEEYGKKETELKALNEQIGTLTKKAILQEAVQGKLVPQIAAEGNARDLLEEIRKERLSHGLDFANAKSGKRKSKKETALAGSNPCDISDDEIPFDIPENWCWCRLGEICNEIKRGKSPKYADKSNFLAFAQKCNVKTGGIDLGLALYLDENSITRYSETDNLVQGDIVINSTGGGTMGRVGLYETKVPAGIKGVYPDSHVTVIRSIGNINQHYLYYVLKLNQPVLEKCGTGSTNQTELKPAVLADFVIPLPPLAEQKRIVDAIEKLLPLCDKLGE